MLRSRSAALLCGFALLSPTLAAYDECADDLMCDPCECAIECAAPGTFSASGTWLYMRPLGECVEVARILERTASFPQTFQGSRVWTDFGFSSGYELSAMYQSPTFRFGWSYGEDCVEICPDQCGWDLRGSYLSHMGSVRQSFHTDFPQAIIPSVGFIPNFINLAFLDGCSWIEDDFDAAALELGGRYLCDPVCVRLALGVSWIDLTRCLSVSYFNVAEQPSEDITSKTDFFERSNCSGVGPRLVLQTDIDLFCGFALSGSLAGDLIIGRQKGQVEQNSIVADIELIPYYITESFSSKTRLVPGLDAKIGLSLTLDWLQFLSLRVDGGYRALYYFSPLSHLEITGQLIPEAPLPSSYFEAATHLRGQDYGLAGWFLGASFLF